jgi:hypothetical protein
MIQRDQQLDVLVSDHAICEIRRGPYMSVAQEFGATWNGLAYPIEKDESMPRCEHAAQAATIEQSWEAAVWHTVRERPVRSLVWGLIVTMLVSWCLGHGPC